MNFQFNHWLKNPALEFPNFKNHIPNQQLQKTRKVHYASTSSVILVPAKEEYVKAGIDLWYGRQEQANAVNEIGIEVRQLSEWVPSLPVVSAMAFLYQPHISHAHVLCDLASRKETEDLYVSVVGVKSPKLQSIIDGMFEALDRIKYWTIYFSCHRTLEILVKTLSASRGMKGKLVDVIVIDEAALCYVKESTEPTTAEAEPLGARNTQGKNILLSKILLFIRAVCGSAALVGLCLTESTGEESLRLRSYAQQHGVDFVWKHPFPEMVNLLPLLLAIRKEGRRKAANSDSRVIQSFSAHEYKSSRTLG